MWFLRLSAALVGVHQVQAFAKAASLIQSVSAKDALLQGSASRQLALFQKYAENLVAAQLQNKEEPDPTEMIEVINAFIEDMHQHALGIHEEDAQAGIRCKAEFETCDALHWPVSKHDELDILKGKVSDAREAHTECRDVQAHSCEKSHPEKGFMTPESSPNTCDLYTNYRKVTKQALLPNCAKLSSGIGAGHNGAAGDEAALSDDHIAADESTTKGASDLETMEACLREMKNWVDDGYPEKQVPSYFKNSWPGPPGLYPRYEECKENDECCTDPAACMVPPQDPGFCCTRQKKLQDDHCTYEIDRHSACDSVVSCHAEKREGCKTDCDDVELRVTSRKADNESMERIQCLLQVIILPSGADNAQLKQEKLTECKSTLEDDNDFARMLKLKREFWNIDNCPPDLDDAPSDPHCHSPLPLQTCSTEYTNQEYGTWQSSMLCGCDNFCEAVMIAAHGQ